MKTCVLPVLCSIMWMSLAKPSPPVVQVYSRSPAEVGKPNQLICYLSRFSPPMVRVDILQNGVEIPGSNQSDLVFEAQWQYYLTKTAPFTPKKGAKYECIVTHEGKTNAHLFDIDD